MAELNTDMAYWYAWEVYNCNRDSDRAMAILAFGVDRLVHCERLDLKPVRGD